MTNIAETLMTATFATALMGMRSAALITIAQVSRDMIVSNYLLPSQNIGVNFRQKRSALITAEAERSAMEELRRMKRAASMTYSI